MAGIEKVCEVSGEYPGWLMYAYKRNLIQIMPSCRKQFRGMYHILFIMDVPDAHGKYDFCLFVPAIPGEVNGYYWNWTYDLSATKRKIKRLLRAYKGLNIVHIPMSESIWWKINNETSDLLKYA